MFSVDRQSFQSLSALALFTFAFLGSEFFFDSRIGLFISAEGVVSAQAMILGASVVGFLAYAPISKLAGGRRELRAAEAVGAIAALVTIAVAESALAMQITGCIAFSSCRKHGECGDADAQHRCVRHARRYELVAQEL